MFFHLSPFRRVAHARADLRNVLKPISDEHIHTKSYFLRSHRLKNNLVYIIFTLRNIHPPNDRIAEHAE